jgi:hypothetical protein
MGMSDTEGISMDSISEEIVDSEEYMILLILRVRLARHVDCPESDLYGHCLRSLIGSWVESCRCCEVWRVWDRVRSRRRRHNSSIYLCLASLVQCYPIPLLTYGETLSKSPKAANSRCSLAIIIFVRSESLCVVYVSMQALSRTVWCFIR